jgi:RimJ/RimL family protein N-acetyltransferase
LKTDVPIFFRHHSQLVPAGEDEAQFGKRWERMLQDQSVLARTILVDEEVAGYVAHFIQLEKPAISYWLDQQFWNRGVATAALQRFLRLIPTRPLYARAAFDNVASLRVLEKCDFRIVGSGSYYSDRHGREIDELVLVLA